MKKLFAIFAILPALFLGGCFWGQKVEVPPAHYGKIQTKNGFAPGVIAPSKFRLAYCWIYCDKLMLVEASDFPIKEEFREQNSLFMPKSDLTMPFDVRGTFAVKSDEVTLNALFDRIPTQATSGWSSGAHGLIPKDVIYTTYGQPVVRDVVRQVVSQYSIAEVSSSREAINAELTKRLNAALKHTPLMIRRFGLADVRFPELILKQKETAAQRRIAIEQEEAEKQIRLVKLQADLEAAKQQRAIRREKAQAALEENQIIAQSVNAKYLAYRRLEVMEEMAKNERAVIVPMEALGTVGMSNTTFRKLDEVKNP